MTLIVIDTNVFVAALRSDGVAARQVVRRALEGRYCPIFSNALWLEYENVLGRPIWMEEPTDQERRQVLAALAAAGKWIKIYYGWRPISPMRTTIILSASQWPAARERLRHTTFGTCVAASCGGAVCRYSPRRNAWSSWHDDFDDPPPRRYESATETAGGIPGYALRRAEHSGIGRIRRGNPFSCARKGRRSQRGPRDLGAARRTRSIRGIVASVVRSGGASCHGTSHAAAQWHSFHATGTHSNPNVSATAAFVTFPPLMFTPAASPAFSRVAFSTPLLASCSA